MIALNPLCHVLSQPPLQAWVVMPPSSGSGTLGGLLEGKVSGKGLYSQLKRKEALKDNS